MRMTKRDARLLSPEAQAEIRLRVINAVQGGMKQAEAARVFGVSRWSVVQWTKVHRANGVEALAPKRRGRRTGEAGKLSIRQAQRIRGLIVGKMPEQLKLPFYLWTRAAVQLLIKREYAVRLSLTAVGGYLKRWGLSVQRPVKRAYERNEEAIAQWLAEVYPRIAARAKREKALIYWGDETGLRSDDVRGRSFAPVGQPAARAGQALWLQCDLGADQQGRDEFHGLRGALSSGSLHQLLRATDQAVQGQSLSDRRWTSSASSQAGQELAPGARRAHPDVLSARLCSRPESRRIAQR